MIRATNQLTEQERKAAKALIASCQAYDQTFREPYLSNMLNFNPNMPAFFLYYQEGELLGLLTVYADDLASHWGLVEDEETETWLGRDRTSYALDSRSDVKVLLADPVYVEEIAQLHYQAFSDAEETLEVSRRYITEALKDSDGLLYILLKEAQVIGVCTVDLSGNSNYLYGLAVAEAYRGQGYGCYLAKSVVNQLIEKNDKAFQIAVEDSNVAAKRLYEKIGFVKQTQVVYLKQKG